MPFLIRVLVGICLMTFSVGTGFLENGAALIVFNDEEYSSMCDDQCCGCCIELEDDIEM